MSGSVLPPLILATSLVAGIWIFILDEEREVARRWINMGAATLKLVLVGIAFVAFETGDVGQEWTVALLPDADLVLRVDRISVIFMTLSAVLWWVTTLFAIGYLSPGGHRRRFFGFFSLSVTATMGVALAGNLLTFLVFFEVLTLTTYPLVVHAGTREALAGGRTYLRYTLAGGTVFLAGVAALYALNGSADFEVGGVLDGVADRRAELTIVYFLLIGGLGVKAAIVPLHGWLPKAMVAPAPVSALLHAVAVVKAGAYGIIRVTYEVYGVDLAAELGVLPVLAGFAGATIVYGSLRALSQDNLKLRLAYSTVSQLSYIMLGVATFGPLATTAALVHLVHQGVMKVTLFFCAGALDRGGGVTRVSRMGGVGRRMPLTMGAFTVAALGMIGVPPLAGFVSKWFLGLGGAAAGDLWVVGVVFLSTVLNAAYFLPPIAAAWFGKADEEGIPEPIADLPARRGAVRPRERLGAPHEAPPSLVVPALTTAVLTVAFGLLAGLALSPLDLAQTVAGDLYGA